MQRPPGHKIGLGANHDALIHHHIEGSSQVAVLVEAGAVEKSASDPSASFALRKIVSWLTGPAESAGPRRPRAAGLCGAGENCFTQQPRSGTTSWLLPIPLSRKFRRAPRYAMMLSRRYEPPWLTRAPKHTPTMRPPARVGHGKRMAPDDAAAAARRDDRDSPTLRSRCCRQSSKSRSPIHPGVLSDQSSARN